MARRILIPELMTPPLEGTGIPVPLDEAHHFLNVLKAKEGNVVEAIDGKGNSQIGSLQKKKRVLFFEPSAPSKQGNRSEHVYPITLAVSLLKKESMEWVIEKATELGVEQVQPLTTERSVVGFKTKSQDLFLTKWKKTANQALKQCGRNFYLQIHEPLSIEGWLSKNFTSIQTHPKEKSCFWFDEAQAKEGSEFSSFKKKIQELNFSHEKQYDLLIGPEGGWSEKERMLLMRYPFNRVSLGATVFRSETACFYTMSIFSFLLRTS